MVNDKKYYFLAGMPRCGNTLLGVLLNQNPTVRVSPQSVVPEMLNKLISLKNETLFKNFPLHNSFDNVIKSIFDSYYADWDYEHIIDKGPWGLPNFLYILKQRFDAVKIIILVRPVVDILASFARSAQQADIKEAVALDAEGPASPTAIFCEWIMHNVLAPWMRSMENILKQDKKLYCLIQYDDLIKDTQNTLNRIYDFLDVPRFNEHEFTNLKQFNVHGVEYDDEIVNNMGDKLHTIRTNKIEKETYNISDYVPTSIINKYEERIESWN